MAVPQPQQVTSDQILDFCCNLVVLDTQLDTFRFAHLSVREFMEKQEDYADSCCNVLAAETCLLAIIGSATDQPSRRILSDLGYSFEFGPEQLKMYSYDF